MGSDETEFFDLASKGTNACWSLNPWSAFLLQPFSNIHYFTQHPNEKQENAPGPELEKNSI